MILQSCHEEYFKPAKWTFSRAWCVVVFTLPLLLASPARSENQPLSTAALWANFDHSKLSPAQPTFPPSSGLWVNGSFRLALIPAHSHLISRSPQYPSDLPPPKPVAAQSPGHLNHRIDEHNFWDTENKLLFTGVAASRTLDYFSTLNMRSRGRQEIFLTNDIVDNHAAFAAIEAGAAAVSIGASYLFHHYHHHQLERWTSIIHASLATSGAIRNYCLKTAQPATTP